MVCYVRSIKRGNETLHLYRCDRCSAGVDDVRGPDELDGRELFCDLCVARAYCDSIGVTWLSWSHDPVLDKAEFAYACRFCGDPVWSHSPPLALRRLATFCCHTCHLNRRSLPGVPFDARGRALQQNQTYGTLSKAEWER